MSGPRHPSPSRRVAAFPRLLVLIMAAGFLLRAGYVVGWLQDQPLAGDADFYHRQALMQADGEWFKNPDVWEEVGLRYDTARTPPGYMVYLTAWSAVGVDTVTGHRLATALLGVATIFGAGMLARRLAGDRAGLLTAGVAALAPMFWMNEVTVFTESLYVPLLLWVLWLLYDLWELRTLRSALFLGGVLGLSILTRGESVMLLPLAVLPLVVVMRDRPWRRRVELALATGGATLCVLAPWTIYNQARFEEPVPLTTGTGGLLPNANCDLTYDRSAALYAYWAADCTYPGPTDYRTEDEWCLVNYPKQAEWFERCRLGDESEYAALGQERGIDYITSHLGELPAVMAARVGRVLYLFRPADQIEFEQTVEERGVWPPVLAFVAWWLLLAPALYGLATLRRTGWTIIPFVGLALVTLQTVMLAIGILRYRVTLDVGVVVLAGIGLDAAWRNLAVRRRPPTSAPGAAPPGDVPPGDAPPATPVAVP